jgi:hypothetical protein
LRLPERQYSKKPSVFVADNISEMYLYPNEAEKVGKFLSTWATSEIIRPRN